MQNPNYMYFLTHFIDNDWKLHERIHSFCLKENHVGDILNKAIEIYLIYLGQPKILAITLDNAMWNRRVIKFFQRKSSIR